MESDALALSHHALNSYKLTSKMVRGISSPPLTSTLELAISTPSSLITSHIYWPESDFLANVTNKSPVTIEDKNTDQPRYNAIFGSIKTDCVIVKLCYNEVNDNNHIAKQSIWEPLHGPVVLKITLYLGML